MPSDKDDETTPTETASAMHRLGLAVCPCCEGSGARDGENCGYCKGARRVTLKQFNDWIGLNPTSKE
jgi:DnaJ-class molecular chaperone